MDKEKLQYHLNRLDRGECYWDREHKEIVEYKYMGQTGLAIVCKPGDSEEGMQSAWGVDPENLEKILKK